jgi:hypothetical protein
LRHFVVLPAKELTSFFDAITDCDAPRNIGDIRHIHGHGSFIAV